LFVDLRSQVRIVRLGGGAGAGVFFLQLPLDVGGAVERLTGDRGSGKEIVDAVIEASGIGSRAFAAMATARFGF
jgi:hypothetical protein